MNSLGRAARAAKQTWRLLWALPCTTVGLLLSVMVLCLGGRARRRGRVLEVVLVSSIQECPPWAQRLTHAAITLGHVIVARSEDELDDLRSHEWVHVRQYEQLGTLFWPAYGLSSLLAWMKGQHPYVDNYFERQAYGKKR